MSTARTLSCYVNWYRLATELCIQNYSHDGPFVVCDAQHKNQIIHSAETPYQLRFTTEWQNILSAWNQNNVYAHFQKNMKIYVKNPVQPLVKDVMQQHVHDDN